MQSDKVNLQMDVIQSQRALVANPAEVLQRQSESMVLAGHLQAWVADAIGMKSTEVFLSKESLDKNLAHHKDVALADYRLLNQIIQTPSTVLKDGARTVFLFKDKSAVYWSVVIKATGTGERGFITSFRRSSRADLARKKRKGAAEIKKDAP